MGLKPLAIEYEAVMRSGISIFDYPSILAFYKRPKPTNGRF
jgi:hypothetical protein